MPGSLATVQDGRILLEFLLAQAPTKRSKIYLQRVAPLGAPPGLPRWLMEDLELCTAVTADTRIVVGSSSTADERIAPFMAGRHV